MSVIGTLRVRVGFSTSDWWVSRIIRFATRSRVSHAFLLIEGLGEPFENLVLEAAWCGWRMSTRERLESGTARIVALATPAQDLAIGLPKAMAWLDEPYNYLGLLGMAWVSIGRAIGQHWHNPIPSVHHMFCSEAVTYVMREAGVAGANDIDPRTTSPEDLLEFFEKQTSAKVAPP